jgi:hypothetical protein
MAFIANAHAQGGAAMKTISLDVHSGWSQLVAVDSEGQTILETRVETKPEPLRRLVGGIPGPKRVLFEEGPLSALIHDALHGIVDELISSDTTRNALVARSEDSNDLRDARCPYPYAHTNPTTIALQKKSPLEGKGRFCVCFCLL